MKDEHKTKIRRKKDERMMKVIQNFDWIDLQVKQECIKFLSCLKNLSETNTGIILTYNNLTATEL